MSNPNKRREGESFDAYKLRLFAEHEALQDRKRGRYVHVDGDSGYTTDGKPKPFTRKK